LVIHHIVSDEWSLGILFRELAAGYTAQVTGGTALLPELPIQYGDYAAWQREWLQGPVFEKQLGYWKERLNGNPPATELPLDHPRKAEPGFQGAGCWLSLGPELSGGIKALAQARGVTLFMFMLAAFKALLHRYTGREDIVLGTPMTGRNRVETERLIGFFVNTLPLRTRVSGEMTFLELLARVREVALGAYSHPDLPFDLLVEALQPERALNQTPFVKIMFLMQQAGGGELHFPGVELEFLDWGTDTSKFDITAGVLDSGEDIIARADYLVDLYEGGTIARFLSHYRNLLEGVVANPGARLRDLPLLSEAGRHQLLREWNRTETDYPRHRCVQELFEDQARRSPEAVAVTFGPARLTYRELDQRANQLAHWLRRAGVNPGEVVGVCLERSLELIVSLLGILKAGAAYAAFDPGLPPARLARMLDGLRLPAWLTQERHKALLDSLDTPPIETRGLCLDTQWALLAHEEITGVEVDKDPEGMAYVCFTSGSTGRPKGVCVPHRAIARLVKQTWYAGFSPDEVFLQLAPVSFDASTFEIWGPLLNGGRLVVMPPGTPSLSELAETIQREGVTTAWFTSGLFNQIIDESPEALKGLRQILTGGDVLSPPHIKKALACLGSCRLVNGYGPTENTTFSTCYSIPPSFDGTRSIPIGRPIANTRCYVLDPHLNPVPIGATGELYVAGDGLASGYLNEPRLTAEKFVPNPFEQGGRMYRTGDLVRYLPDGNLDFLGRADLQVKVRGFRIELGEIEAALLAHPRVRQCALVARPDAAGTKQLLAYVVREAGSQVSDGELRRFLGRRLPDYMLPAGFHFTEELPLSPSGKVDRRALPDIQPGTARAQDLVEPGDDLERQLREIWSETLNTGRIGIRDQFFALGGHSLLAVKLLARVEKAFGKRISVSALFQNPTIELMAALVRGNASARPTSSLVEIQANGGRKPLFLVHGAGGGMFWGYGNLARHLGTDQPVFAFKSRGLDGLPELETIEELAEAYLGDLRAFQPEGPYHLGGYCFGGLVAYEMARRLFDEGRQVGLLALINSTAPNSSYTQFRWTPSSAVRFGANICLRTAYSVASHPEKLGGFFKWKARSLARRVQGRVPVSHQEPARSLDHDEWVDLSDYPEDQRRVWRTHLEAIARYHPQPYRGTVTLFRTPVHLLYCSYAADYGWADLALGGLDIQVIPGAHETIMEEPGVKRLAEAFRRQLKGKQPARG
jgi:amino acid adenylation domain-containing protein